VLPCPHGPPVQDTTETVACVPSIEIILRDFINATVGFTKLSDVTHRSAKSLMRMLGPRGNPQARNLFEIVAYLQHAEGVRFEIRSTRAALRTKRRPSSQGTKRAVSAALSH